MAERFPSFRLRLALIAYRALWWVGLPLVLLYLRRRGRKDADYTSHLAERFGSYGPTTCVPHVWVHAVSLGEMRSAMPLIRALLDRSERVVLTHFTPAGRREAMKSLGDEIAAGLVRAVWVPFELGFAWRLFFRTFRPRFGLVMEIEIWPEMIMECRKAGVPLFMCNAQYPSKSYARDTKGHGLRAELMRGFAGALVKSDLQRERFASVGVAPIAVTGETRFDQPIPPAHLAAAAPARAALAGARPVVALASVVEGEDDIYLDAIEATFAAHDTAGLPRPFFVYVPRAPERFGAVADLIAARGLSFLKRSEVLDADLALSHPAPADILLGDSLGEMYFYLSMADRVIVGGGFTPHGAHNIIEPLAVKKPVIVGPDIHTIEYPAVEAIAAGVCLHVKSPAELEAALAPGAAFQPSEAEIAAFFAAHSGATKRTLAAIPELMRLTSR
ncbi:MAG TPA: glycosyltransferase N-terminal domain-containing protein [Albidovulum sp.]|uniref:3-deoxy-D-manno-octulosonic acid transferase n=1 Tax=Albidovulum sp. TaxID=1872424 RepID=UPI002CE797CF|nr:glycosyltransferase N-terminal domain-containing protein [Albidovulum sp.]